MQSWDNSTKAERVTPPSLDPTNDICPHRVWFGDYALNYCKIDYGLCEYTKDCRYLCKITTKDKDE